VYESLRNCHLDGILIDSAIFDWPISVASTGNTIGANYANSASECSFNGHIDDIRIYDRALTADEIDSLYHIGGWGTQIDTGPMAYYPFNGNANDESGNDHDGTVNGAILTTDRFGNANSAYDFNNDNINIRQGWNSESGSISMWVYRTGSGVQRFLSDRNSSQDYISLFVNSSNMVGATIYGNSFEDIGQTIVLSQNRWYHAVVNWGTGGMQLYINGQLNDSSTNTQSWNATSDLLIGNSQAYPTQGWNGKIDDIHIFDHALTELEIDSLYHLGGWPLPDLVAYYPFSGNANDESGNGNHGVPATQSPTLTTDRFGNLNSAYSFEGTDDYFLLPDSLLYQLNTVSFFAWANVSSISSHGSILSCALDQSASACQELLNFKPDTVLGCQIACFNADVNIFYDIPDFECGEWVFVGFTYDGDTISSWYNGQLAETSAFSGGAIKLYGHTAIGRRVGGAWDFNGLIDDVSIYSRAINASEIDSLYHLVGWPLPAAPQNLIASSSDQAVVLTWNQNSESDLLKYNIYKGIDNSTITLLDSVLNPIPIDTIYVDNDVTFGEAYHYYVTAVIQSGIESNPSNEVIIKLDSYPVVAGIPDQVIHEAEEFADFDLDDYLIEQDGDSIIWNYSIQSGSPPPDWSIEPSDFEYDMSLTGLIQFNGIESQDSLDQVAAFVGDECRGIANPVYFPVTGSYLIGMVIFSNQVSGELVEFKAYDASTGIVGIVLESYVFTSNVIIGSGLTPEILTCTYQPNEPELFVSIDDSNIVDVSYLEGWFGTGTIIFSAMDYTVNEYSDSDSAVFTVLETENSPPELDIPASVEMLEDDTVRITLVASDVDEDTLTFYAEIDTSAIHLDVVDSILILIPQGNWYGNASILVTVSDGYETDSSNINLQVLPVNDPPGQFSLSTPANEYTWYDTSVVTFDWGNSIDIDGDSVKYIFHVYNSQYETYIQCDSSFYIAIYDSVEFPIGTLLSWNVFATDGIDTVSSNEDHWVFLIIQVGTVEDGVIPTQFALHQNYPNPFNPITTIQYDLPERSEIQITVLDLLGRKVITLVSEIQDAGYKSVKWNATNSLGQSVSAGVYFYQIIAGDYVQTRKMVLLK